MMDMMVYVEQGRRRRMDERGGTEGVVDEEGGAMAKEVTR
jgi:hypothetical protein